MYSLLSSSTAIDIKANSTEEDCCPVCKGEKTLWPEFQIRRVGHHKCYKCSRCGKTFTGHQLNKAWGTTETYPVKNKTRHNSAKRKL